MNTILLILCNALSCFIISTILFQFMNGKYKRSSQNRYVYIVIETVTVIFTTCINMLNHSILNLVVWGVLTGIIAYALYCNGVQREHNKKLNNGLPILHKVPPKRDYGRYFCIMAEKGGTSHGGLTEKLSPFFHAKKQEVNAYGR